jgi:hypothetical protein
MDTLEVRTVGRRSRKSLTLEPAESQSDPVAGHNSPISGSVKDNIDPPDELKISFDVTFCLPNLELTSEDLNPIRRITDTLSIVEYVPTGMVMARKVGLFPQMSCDTTFYSDVTAPSH